MKGDVNSILLANLPALYEAHTLDTLPAHLSNFISRLISTDLVAYNEVNLKHPRLVSKLDQPELDKPSFYQAFAAHLHEHPLICHQRQTGDLTARKISDFLSKAQFHRLGLYQELYRPLGAEDQMAVTLHATPDTIIAMAMNRSRRNFTEAHRTLLNLLRPHLAQAYRNAERLTALQKQMAGMAGILDGMPLGLIVLDQSMKIQFMARRARNLLQQYFRLPVSSKRLPPALCSWLLHTHRPQAKPLPAATSSFSVDGPEGKLVIRCTKQPGRPEIFLVLEESVLHLSPAPLQSLGLTPREAEVLVWVAQGKSNPEIGVILDSSARTVQKHLEHIFAKLGVESRTAAARRALEILNQAV